MRASWLDSVSSGLLAWLLAFVIWLAAGRDERPLLSRPFPGPADPPIAIDFVGVPPGRAVYAADRRTVTLRLRGVGTALDDLGEHAFEAVADVAGIPPNAATYQADVRVRCRDTWRCLRAGLRITAHDPLTVTVRVDRAVTATLPVEVEIDNDPAPGYALIGKTTDPPEATLTGAQAQMAKVKKVVAAVGGVAETRSRRLVEGVPLDPRDEFGRSVPDVRVEPRTVAALLHVVRRGVPRYVTPVYVGKVADGYLLADFAVEPQSVQLLGPRELIDQLPDLAPIIDIGGLDADLVKVLPLDLPSGVTALNAPAGVTVTVKVAPLVDAKSLDVALDTLGLDPALEVVLKPATVRVLLNGPRPVLDGLKPADIAASIDLKDLAVGAHAVAPVVVPPEGIRARSIQPAKVEAVIRRKSAPP